MDILVIALLILFGLLFCVVEVLILPGVSLGGILSVACNGSAIYLAFTQIGGSAGYISIATIVVLSLVAIVVSLRSKTWSKLALDSQIESVSAPSPQGDVAVGDRGTTISRLSPMGKVEIAGRSYEAKSADVYIDAKSEIEVVGFENYNVVVRRVD